MGHIKEMVMARKSVLDLHEMKRRARRSPGSLPTIIHGQF